MELKKRYIACIYQLNMAVKTVALDAEAYELLHRAKRPGETCSEVVRRKFLPPPRISDLAGSLGDLPPGVWTELARDRTTRRRRDALRQKRLERVGERS